MKKILYLILFTLLSVASFGQTYVADTTDLKLIPNVNNGKIAFVVQTNYQGAYRATNSDQTPNSATIFASTKTGWYWVKVTETEVVDATRYGMKNDGTSISQDDFVKFCANTNGKKVFWPDGTYSFANLATNIVSDVSVDWVGSGENTIIENFDEFTPTGDFIKVSNMNFEDCDRLFYYNSTEPGVSSDSISVTFENVKTVNTASLIYGSSSSTMTIDKLKLINVITDSNAAGQGIFFNTKINEATIDGLWMTNPDSGITSLLILGDNNSSIQEPSVFNNVNISGWYSSDATGTANNMHPFLVYSRDNLTLTNSSMRDINVPRFYLRGRGVNLYKNVSIQGDSVRSGYETVGAILTKGTASDFSQPLIVINNCDIKTENQIAVFTEGLGTCIIQNSSIVNNYTGNLIHFDNGGIGFENETGFYAKIQGSFLKNKEASGEIAEIESIFDKIVIEDNFIEGAKFLLARTDDDTTEVVELLDNVIYTGTQVLFNVGDIYANELKMIGNYIQTNGNVQLSPLERATIKFNTWKRSPTDSIGAGSTSGDDFYFAPTTGSDIIITDNEIDISGFRRCSGLYITSGTSYDTVIYSRNTFTGLTVQSSTRYGFRLDTPEEIGYVKIEGNVFNFSGGTNPPLFFAGGTINNADIINNTFSTDASTIIGGTSGTINKLNAFNNRGISTFDDGNITITYDSLKTSQIYDLSGNAYLTSATGYTQSQLYTKTELNDTLAFYQLRPEEVQVGTSRNFLSSDVEQIVRCTDTLTLTIPLNFSAMAVDRIITILNATSVATVVTIEAASGVTLNGSSGGTVTLTGPYTSGVLFKSGTNTYEFY